LAQSSSGGFNVTIRALDEVTSVADRIKRELKSLGEAPQLQVKATNSLFDKLGLGIKETGRGLAEIGHKARETGERLHKAFEPIAEITGLGGVAAIGSIGGITLALDKYAASGANLLRTSQAMGINVETLQAFQQGAKLAGSDAGALTEGLDVLNQKLRGAAWGRDAGAIAVFKQLNIAVRDSNGQIRKAQDVLPEIANAVKRNLIDPYVAAEIASQTLGTSARVLLPYLRDGAEGLDRFNREAKGFGAVLGPEAVWQAEEFERSQREVGLALDGVGHAISDKVLPVLTPMLKDFAHWVATSPDVTKGVEGIARSVEDFGKWIKEIDWEKTKTGLSGIGTAFANVGTALGTVLEGMKWMEAHPDITGLVLGVAGGGRLAGAPGAVVGGILGFNLGARSDPNRPLSRGEEIARQAYTNMGRPLSPTEQATLDDLNRRRAGSTPPGRSSAGVPWGQASALIKQYESSGGQNIRNQKGSSAFGPWQILDSTWGESAARAGVDVAKYPHAWDAPVEEQEKVAKHLYETRGFQPWTVGNPALRNALGPGTPSGGGGFWHGLGKVFGITGANAAPMPGFAGGGHPGAAVDDMVKLAGSRGSAVREFLKNPNGVVARDPDLGLWCAEFTNAYLQHAGVPGTGSLMAGSFAKWGDVVDPTGVRKGDVLLNQNRAHVGVATGRSRFGTNGLDLEEISSNSLGPGGEVQNLPGLRWRSDVEVRRSRELAAAQEAAPVTLAAANQNGAGDSSHHVEVSFANAPQGMRTGVQASGSGSANFTLRTQHALETW
jgi:hypothetical protein